MRFKSFLFAQEKIMHQKHFTWTWSKRGFGIFVWQACCCLLLCGVPTQAAPSTSQIKAEIREETDRRVNLELDQESMALELGISLPIQPPALPLAEVKAEYQSELDTRVRKVLPLEREQRRKLYEKKARAHYQISKIHDHVKVKLTRGIEHSGILTERTPERVKIGSLWIAVRDLDRESREQLDPAAHEEKVAREARKRLVKDDSIVDGIKNELREDYTKQLFARHGYVRHNRTWVPLHDVLGERLKAERLTLRKRLYPLVKTEILEGYGYSYVEGRWLAAANLVAVAEVVASAEPEKTEDARKAEEKPDGMDGAPSRPRPTSENGMVLDSRGRQIGFRDWENASEEWDWSFAKKKPDLSDHKELEVDNSEYENYLKRRKKEAMKRHRARGPDKEAIPKYTGKGEVLQGFFKL